MAKKFSIREDVVPVKRHQATRIITNIFFVLCFLVLILTVVFVVQAKQSGNPVEVFGWRSYLIATGSMEPTYSVDGLVVSHDDNINKVQVGDVVSFAAAGLNNQAALHRVIAISCANHASAIEHCEAADKQFWTKGDNNPHPDGAPVTVENYIGRVKFNTNLTASWLQEMRKPFGWITAVALPFIALILLYFGARWLITTPRTWRGRIIAFCVVAFLLSTSVLVSYVSYIVRQVDQMNSDLVEISTKFAQSDTATSWKVMGEPVIGRVEIPTLGLDYPIVNYDNSATTLNLAIAHFGGAPLNHTGNAVLVGHRAFGDLSPFNLFFTRIDQLKQGDEIYITDLSRQRVKYVVRNYSTVSTNDEEILTSVSDDREVTLVAASYNLDNRYMVRAVAE